MPGCCTRDVSPPSDLGGRRDAVDRNRSPPVSPESSLREGVQFTCPSQPWRVGGSTCELCRGAYFSQAGRDAHYYPQCKRPAK